MRKVSRLAVQRAALYFFIAVLGLSLLIGGYSWVSGRPVAEVVVNLWIPLLVALVMVVVVALRDQRQEEAPGTESQN